MSTEPMARGPFLLVAAASSAAAGLVHAAAAGSHADLPTMVRLFALVAVLQAGWAALVVIHPSRWSLVAGAALHAVSVAAWLMSRTVGWPVVESMTEPGTVGVQDSAAVLLALLAAGSASVAAAGIASPRWFRVAPVPPLAALLVLGLAVPAIAADHAHDHDHAGEAHDHGDEEAHDHPDDGAHDHGDGHDAAGEDVAGTAYDHDDPVVSLDDPRLSADQRAAAQALVDDVRAEMERFSDPARVEAEGYVSIGDGVTGYEHFSHPVLREDPITLEPSRPESIVFRVNPDGTKDLVSAMFIMPPGSTMDDVPDIAGTLTTWHDHQDLCWLGDRVVGTVDADGNCPFGEFREGQPMMHVWLEPHPCGPFAGLEGHGGDCTQHQH
ncbi:MAG: hypothetical protein U5K29_15325 [Acidimicrobiales bacterium]|nr:hypothetical protein [Acidimicrobiales bacterium]